MKCLLQVVVLAGMTQLSVKKVAHAQVRGTLQALAHVAVLGIATVHQALVHQAGQALVAVTLAQAGQAVIQVHQVLGIKI